MELENEEVDQHSRRCEHVQRRGELCSYLCSGAVSKYLVPGDCEDTVNQNSNLFQEARQ